MARDHNQRRLLTLAPGVSVRTAAAVLTALVDQAIVENKSQPTLEPLSDGVGIYAERWGGLG